MNVKYKASYHYVYKMTCVPTGKYYIGIHSTDNLSDGYTGSGKVLKRAIVKYRLTNFEFEAFEFLPNRKVLLSREKELVSERVLRDPLCMNLQPGGNAGWDYINANPEIQKRANINAQTALKRKPELREKFIKAGAHNLANARAKGLVKPFDWTGRKHKQETKDKIGRANF